MPWLDGNDEYLNPLTVPSMCGALTPPGGSLLGWANASGWQYYRFGKVIDKKTHQERMDWDLQMAEAPLTDDAGNVVGHHDFSGGGPTWLCQEDGSYVVGKMIEDEVHGADNITWVLLEQISRTDGVMGQVDFIQRLATVGGKLQYTAEVGTEDAMSYSAIYYFWGTPACR